MEKKIARDEKEFQRLSQNFTENDFQSFSDMTDPPSYDAVASNCDTRMVMDIEDEPFITNQPTHSTNRFIDDYSNPNNLITTNSQFQDNFVLSIASLFFCICIGVLALMNSLNARNARDIGDMERAEEKSIKAKSLAISAIIIGIIVIVINIIIKDNELNKGHYEEKYQPSPKCSINNETSYSTPYPSPNEGNAFTAPINNYAPQNQALVVTQPLTAITNPNFVYPPSKYTYDANIICTGYNVCNEQKSKNSSQFSAHHSVEIPMNDFDSKRLSSKQAQEPVVRQSLIKNATDYANNPQRKVPNGLCLSVLSMFLCLCIGGCSLQYHVISQEAKEHGDIDKAIRKASISKRFAKAAIFLGTLIFIGYTILAWYLNQKRLQQVQKSQEIYNEKLMQMIRDELL